MCLWTCLFDHLPLSSVPFHGLCRTSWKFNFSVSCGLTDADWTVFLASLMANWIDSLGQLKTDWFSWDLNWRLKIGLFDCLLGSLSPLLFPLVPLPVDLSLARLRLSLRDTLYSSRGLKDLWNSIQGICKSDNTHVNSEDFFDLEFQTLLWGTL